MTAYQARKMTRPMATWYTCWILLNATKSQQLIVTTCFCDNVPIPWDLTHSFHNKTKVCYSWASHQLLLTCLTTFSEPQPFLMLYSRKNNAKEHDHRLGITTTSMSSSCRKYRRIRSNDLNERIKSYACDGGLPDSSWFWLFHVLAFSACDTGPKHYRKKSYSMLYLKPCTADEQRYYVCSNNELVEMSLPVGFWQ